MDEPAREELGRRGVTRREREVLDAVAERLTNAEIAARLCVSERTVESHVSALLHKLGARTRLDLAGWARRRAPTRALEEAFPRQLDAVVERGVCLGREEERQRLVACWERSAAGTTLALVRGEAGIGKSRLAAEVAVEVHRRGGGVALGACTDGPQRPYEPFMAAIEADVERLSRDELGRRLAATGRTFARLSPDIARRLDLVGPDVEARETEPGAVPGALLDYLSAAARTRRLLFVIEDLHWASVGTREVVAHIGRAGGEAPLMLLVTTRDESPFVDDAFSAFLGRIGSFAAVEVVALSGLDVAAAATLIDALGADLDPEAGVRATGGNPLFLQELAREGPGGRSLRGLVADRFSRLSGGDLAVLDMAAVAGEQIDVPLIATALDRSIDDVLDALERAETARLVGPGAKPGCFAFTHDVYRSVRYASLTTSQRFRLHAALAQALRDRITDGAVSADLARHACLAGPRFDPSAAVALAGRAGDVAAHATDHGEAAAHYRRALDALDLVTGADDAARLELSIRLGASLAVLGEAEGQVRWRTAAEEARRRDDPLAFANAVCSMVWTPSGSATPVSSDQSVKSLAEVAYDLLPPSEEALRAAVLSVLGVQLLVTDAPQRGTEMVDEAMRVARRLGDPLALARVLAHYRFCGTPMDMEQRLACGHELIELGDRTGRDAFTLAGCQQLWWCYRELGDRDEMDRWYEAASKLARGPDVEQLSHPPALAIIDGDLARAERLTDEFMEWSTVARGYVDQLRFAIEDLRGRAPTPAEIDRRFGGTVPADVVEALVARAWARLGQGVKAREMLDRVRRKGFPTMYAAGRGAMALCCWAEAAALATDNAAAEDAAARLEPLAGRLVDSGAIVWDTVDRVRALLRISLGDPAEAAEVAAGAVAASRRRRTPIFLGRELVVLVAAQRRAGADASETLVALDEALEIASRTGARIIAKDAELILDLRPEAVRRDDQFGLTRREREILDLVAQGATNAHIASALGISPATVRKHLEHAYAKLDVSTRTAAVARTTAAHRSTRTDEQPR